MTGRRGATPCGHVKGLIPWAKVGGEVPRLEEFGLEPVGGAWMGAGLVH